MRQRELLCPSLQFRTEIEQTREPGRAPWPGFLARPAWVVGPVSAPACPPPKVGARVEALSPGRLESRSRTPRSHTGFMRAPTSHCCCRPARHSRHACSLRFPDRACLLTNLLARKLSAPLVLPPRGAWSADEPRASGQGCGAATGGRPSSGCSRGGWGFGAGARPARAAPG